MSGKVVMLCEWVSMPHAEVTSQTHSTSLELQSGIMLSECLTTSEEQKLKH